MQGRGRRATPAQLRSFWSADLMDAARAGESVRIACSPEDHTGLRQDALRIAQAESCDVALDTSTPRLVRVTFTAQAAKAAG